MWVVDEDESYDGSVLNDDCESNTAGGTVSERSWDSTLNVLASYCGAEELAVALNQIWGLLGEGETIVEDTDPVEPVTHTYDEHDVPGTAGWDVTSWHWKAQLIQSMLVDEDGIMMVSVFWVTVVAVT